MSPFPMTFRICQAPLASAFPSTHFISFRPNQTTSRMCREEIENIVRFLFPLCTSCNTVVFLTILLPTCVLLHHSGYSQVVTFLEKCFLSLEWMLTKSVIINYCNHRHASSFATTFLRALLVVALLRPRRLVRSCISSTPLFRPLINFD